MPVLRSALRFGLPWPHGLATLLGLDGESAQDADLYEIWLAAWLACLSAVLVCRQRLVRRAAVRQHRDGPETAACRSGHPG